MLLCHVMSSVRKMANNLAAMAFAQAVATGSDVCCKKFLGRLLLLPTVCPVACRAVAAGKSGSFFIYR